MVSGSSTQHAPTPPYSDRLGWISLIPAKPIQNECDASLPCLLSFYGLGVLLLIPGPLVSVAPAAGQPLLVLLQLSTSYTLEEEGQGKAGMGHC